MGRRTFAKSKVTVRTKNHPFTSRQRTHQQQAPHMTRAYRTSSSNTDTKVEHMNTKRKREAKNLYLYTREILIAL